MIHQSVETDRLRLIQPHADHLPFYTAYCASDRSRFVGGPFDVVKAFDKFASMAGHWTLRGFGRFILIDKSTARPLGHVGALQMDADQPPEMTWTLWSGADEGKGYALEAARAYLAQAVDRPGFSLLMIRVAKDNARSRTLAEKIGAKLDDGASAPDWTFESVTYRLVLADAVLSDRNWNGTG